MLLTIWLRPNIEHRTDAINFLRLINWRPPFWNFLTLSFCFFSAFSRGILITMRVETGLDHEPDDQPNRRNWRVCTYAEHVQPRNMCQHARKLPLFLRRWICVRRQLPSRHRCESVMSLRRGFLRCLTDIEYFYFLF